MNKLTVCLDAGHGGHDPGAVGPAGTKEKDITILVAHQVKKHLEDEFEIIMIRYDDVFVPLADRSRRANSAKADVFVSIHCNSANVSTANGVETFHYPGSKKGEKLATHIQNELVKASGLRDRGVKTSSKLWVLKETAMPAILTELGFLNNPEEEKVIREIPYQLKCAKAIAQGIELYVKEVLNE